MQTVCIVCTRLYLNSPYFVCTFTGNANIKNDYGKSYGRVSQVWSGVFGLCVEIAGHVGSNEKLQAGRERRILTEVGFEQWQHDQSGRQ